MNKKLVLQKENSMIRKAIGSIIAVIGFLICGWGLWIFGGSIYYLSAKTPFMGDAAGIGFFYGLAIMGIGFVPLLVGIFIAVNPKALLGEMAVSKKHKIIIWAAVALIIIFMGITTKNIATTTKGVTSTRQTIALFGCPIGEQETEYSYKNSSLTDASPRITRQTKKGLFTIGYYLGFYKHVFIIATLLMGFLAFILVKNNK